ncbi:aminotransferase class I/II-fold pyridoxal phosphate-dependent enzyme [Hanamia caeni]|uniref:Aminotransferase class I/II-fold pyridoxal phosphate-dependent enzyme n=1 Tax=Hanamia caeni TaxID=2294116 RepID=A0A3M9NLN6_9BACT|nr:aminotransferase class I/II-fold pyridoxal phosphate-dependent enzyme [Hanamia caeni]RNI38700.1 aminotransferase class I/II-fold pyridoxal phosphate-dependent enzyme [Hanamia caeni]
MSTVNSTPYVKKEEKLSQLANTLVGSEIVRLGGEIKQKIKRGETIYNFTIGDFDAEIFPIPQKLEDEIVNAYRNKLTTYPPADGIIQLRESVSKFINDREGLRFETNEILIAAGGRPLIYTVYRAIVDRGDKVIYSVPSWNNNHYVHFTEGKHQVIETTAENNFMPTAEDIQPHVHDAVLIALCSPLNPTGTVFQKEELEKICDMVLAENNRRGEEEKKLYVMYDQMYWMLTYGETRHYNPVSLRPEMKKYTIFIDGISKAFASTGVRVGWALGPEWVLSKMKAINSHLGAWSPMAEQNATAKFLVQKEVVDDYLSVFRKELQERLQLIYDGFMQLKSEGYAVAACAPQAAIYLTIQLSLTGKRTINNGNLLSTQSEVTTYILENAKLAVVPFYAFGAAKDSDWYRLSVGTCRKEEIPEMFSKLKEALDNLH